MGIRAETSLADPDTCKFTVSRILHPVASFFFRNQERGIGSPLVERLFALPALAHVLVAEIVVTIGKATSASWAKLKVAIGTAIRTQPLTGVPAILEMAAYASALERSDAELGVIVQKLLDGQVSRSVVNHGGKISIVEVHQGKLLISMSGGCQGCASSQVTLRQGFEVTVKKAAPEIVEIIDATDHKSGNNPFLEHEHQRQIFVEKWSGAVFLSTSATVAPSLKWVQIVASMAVSCLAFVSDNP